MRVDELDFELPPERIAQMPLERRDAARLLVMGAARASAIEDRRIVDLPSLLPPALWVVNDTRVRPARLLGQKTSGGKAELLLVEPLGEDLWVALGKASKALRPDTELLFAHGLRARVLARRPDGSIEVRLEGATHALEDAGCMPLPPYIRRPAETSDDERYQTIFADQPGAVAAPTAGLHFSESLVSTLRERGHEIARVTLHVGPGTFRPIKTNDLDAHPMHEERYTVSPDCARAIELARAASRPVVAVGTTVVRTLESAALGDEVRAGSGRTRLLIQPGYRARVVDHLLTNFHLPRSTLLALVMAFGGVDRVRAAYLHAVEAGYRFFSYGDAMLLKDVRRPVGDL